MGINADFGRFLCVKLLEALHVQVHVAYLAPEHAFPIVGSSVIGVVGVRAQHTSLRRERQLGEKVGA